MQAQVLDTMDLERERGITIKAQSVTLGFKSMTGELYQLNFIDTPGHVDFSYEVSRSLAACEGALLVVDAAQGVEAQSVANCYTALEQGLEVLPVINKIDLPSADPSKVIHEIEEIIGIPADDAALVSAKTGQGVPELLEQLVKRIPAPKGDPDGPLQALIIDSWFDNYVGVVSLVRVMNGALRTGEKIRVMSTGRSHSIDKLGRFSPKPVTRESLETGEVGFVIAGIKEIDGAPVGDTITLENNPAKEPLAGFKQVQPRVFAGLFPVSSDDYEQFREALKKLKLNDSALHYEPEVSTALGFGFRCGFLGLLHMDIVQERLEREYGLNLITSAPTVIYEVLLTDGSVISVDNPSKLPPQDRVSELREPIIIANILVPPDHVGAVLALCSEKRGVKKDAVSRQSGIAAIRIAAGRNRARFLRSPQILEPRLRLVRLRVQPLSGGALGEARCSDQRRSGRCPVADRASRQLVQSRPGIGGQDAGADSAPNVRYRGAGSYRKPHHCARQRQGDAQECAGKMLRG